MDHAALEQEGPKPTRELALDSADHRTRSRVGLTMSERRGVLSAGTCASISTSRLRAGRGGHLQRGPGDRSPGRGGGIQHGARPQAPQSRLSGRGDGGRRRRRPWPLSLQAMRCAWRRARRVTRGASRRDDERRRLQCRSQRPAHPFLSSGRSGRDDARRLRFLFDAGEDFPSWIAGRAQGDGPGVARRRQRLGRGAAQGARRRPRRPISN